MFWRDALALLFALGDRRTPAGAKWAAALALLYALSPVDLLPDVLPVAGWGDDLVVVPAILALAARGLPPTVLAESRARTARLGRQLPWLLPGLAALLLLGAGLMVWGLVRSLGG